MTVPTDSVPSHLSEAIGQLALYALTQGLATGEKTVLCADNMSYKMRRAHAPTPMGSWRVTIEKTG